MPTRAYYSANIRAFLNESTDSIIGKITQNHPQQIEHLQTGAWKKQIEILQSEFASLSDGEVFFEFLIPRMGRRADVILLYKNLIFVFEFKVGENTYPAQDIRQAHGYALDLSHFHKGSHDKIIIPVLVSTEAEEVSLTISKSKDLVFQPLEVNKYNIKRLVNDCTKSIKNQPILDHLKWIESSYKPTPTIIEAAQALYTDHEVDDISRNDAGATNLNITSKKIKEIIHYSNINKQKSICFVTGVPGAGKTLVGVKYRNIKC